MKKISLIIAIVGFILILTGCSDADTVSYNITQEADKFNTRRRITFINLRTGDYLFQMTGLCSVQGGTGDDSNNELDVICKVGDGKYQKHMLYIANETTYVIEQLETNNVSKYDYELVFRPEAIVPVEIKTEVGE